LVGYATVLVGTDGSASALTAVDRAAALAAAEQAVLILVCVASPVPAAAAAAFSGPEFGAPRHDQQVPGADAAVAALGTAAERAEAAGAPKVTAVLAEGDPAQALLGVARERGADCIVVGSRGINSLSGRLLGSVPADVAYRSPCDVLIVHTDEGVAE
jgi:nucleotide-binding universal stress UspA family protein